MGFVDGIQRRKKPETPKEQVKDHEPVFSEFISSPVIEEKVDNFAEKVREPFHQRNISFSFREKIFSFLGNINIPKFSPAKVFALTTIALIVLIGSYKIQTVKAKTNELSNAAARHIELSFENIEDGNLAEALKEADMAKEKISEMKLLAQSYGQDVQYFKHVPFKSSRLAANERILDASYTIINTITGLNDNFGKLLGENTDFNSNCILDLETISKSLKTSMNRSSETLVQSKNDLEKIKSSIGPDNKENVEKAISAIDKGIGTIDFFNTLAEKDLPWLSGGDGQPKKILILFQNNAELRGGSGGSLGSFGVANFSDGKLKNIDFGKNIYKIDKPFAAQTHIEPPEIIKFLNPNWVMKDSGWVVDGPEASRTIIDFYKKETGEEVDGTMMIDTTAVISLLKVVGPIDMKKYDKTISADNFREILEEEVHESYFDNKENLIENEPKKIIGDMIPILMQKMLESMKGENAGKILSSLSGSLSSKDITFYFKEESFQKEIERNNLSGSVKQAIGDYLYINNSNIAGEKSSLSVEETINLNIEISDSGKISNQINLVREHKGKNTKPDGVNKNFVRLLLPEDSKIKDFKGITGNYEQVGDQGFRENSPYWTTKEAGKSVLNFWMTTKPGEKSELNILYETNYSVVTNGDFTYNLTVQKQPGANPDNLMINIEYPEGFEPANVESFDTKKRVITIPYLLAKDKTFKFRFKKN